MLIGVVAVCSSFDGRFDDPKDLLSDFLCCKLLSFGASRCL